MTISSNTRKAGPFTGAGTTDTFPFTFKVFTSADLLVEQKTVATDVTTTLVLTTDYTVTLNQNQNSNPGGSITLTAGNLATGQTLAITSDINNEQPMDLTNQGGFFPAVINDSADRQVIQIQQLQELLNRTPKLDLTTAVTGGVSMADPQASSFLQISASGNRIIMAGSAFSAGSYILGFADAVSRTVASKFTETPSVKDFGAIGDGVTDDTEAIQNAFDALSGTANHLFFPDGDYLVSDSITVKCHIHGSGTIVTDGVMSSKPVFITGTTGLFIKDIIISGDSDDKTNSVTGLEIAHQATVIENVNIAGFAIGIELHSFIVSVSDSYVVNSKTNVSIYGLTGPPLSECNLVNFYNTKMYGADEYTAWVGDTRPSGTITGAVMGAVINFVGCDLENSCTRVGNVGELNFIGCYFEAPTSDVALVDEKHIYVDGTEGIIREIKVEACYFSLGEYAVFCDDSPNPIEVSECFFNGVTVCGLYLTSDIYGASFVRNKQAGSFADGVDFHTGMRSGVTSNSLYQYTSDMMPDGGRPFSITEPDSSVLGQRYMDTSGNEWVSTSISQYRCYKTPTTGKSGSISSGVFTCTTPSDAASFNGGDAIVVGGNYGYIQRVDYDNGIIYCEEYVSSGSTTISQIQQTWAQVGKVFEVLTPDAYNAAVAAKVEFGSSASTDNGKANRFKFTLEDGGGGNANGQICVLTGISRDSGTEEDMVYWSTAISNHPTGDKTYAPYADNDRKLGLTSKRWSECHAVTYYAGSGSAGVSGSFTAASGETITVTNGIITGIV